MKPKSLSAWGVPLTLIGLIALSAGCGKSPLTPSTTLPPIGATTADPQLGSIPLGSTTGTGYQVIYDNKISGATTTVEVTEWGAYVYGEHNTVEIAVEPGYVMVGGGAQTQDPNGNPAKVDGMLTAAYPVADGTYSTYVASNKDQAGYTYFSNLWVYVIGIKLYGPGGTVIPTTDVTPHLYTSYALSNPADWPTITLGVGSQYYNRILSGGALDDYGTGYGNLLTEDDWSNTLTTAAGKDQHKADVCSIYDFVIAMDNNPITGFGNLNVDYFSATTSISSDLQTIGIQVPNGWGITGVGGKSTWSGYGRLLYNMYAQTASQAIISSKDDQTVDISGTVGGIVSAVQPAQ